MANSLDPDQARQNVGPDMDPNCLQRSAADDKIFAVVGGLVINVYKNSDLTGRIYKATLGNTCIL